MLRILLISLLLTFATAASAQTFFEGTMAFDVALQGEMAEMLEQNEPNDKMTMHIRNGDYIVLLAGGKMPKTFLFMADSNYEYSIDQTNQLAFRYSAHMDINRETHQLEQAQDLGARPTGETAEVMGVTCQVYQLRKPEATFLYYVSDQYRVDVSLFPEPCRAKASFLAPGLEGRIPLKTIRKEPNLTVVTTATAITPRTFQEAQFDIPAGFQVKKRDYRY